MVLYSMVPAELLRVALTVQYGPQWDNHPNDFNISKNHISLIINGEFGKLPSHQMAVAKMGLIGKKISEINFGYRALPYILVHTNIFSVFNESFQSFPQSFPYIW